MRLIFDPLLDLLAKIGLSFGDKKLNEISLTPEARVTLHKLHQAFAKSSLQLFCFY